MNALPAEVDVIPIEDIAAKVNRTSQTVKRALRKAGVPLVYPTPRQPSVRRADYSAYLASTSSS
jgi:hypothetical protein